MLKRFIFVIRCLLVFAVFFSGFAVSAAQSSQKRRMPYDFSKPQRSKIKPSKFRLYLEYIPEYDSNVLKYSQFEMDRFENGTEPINKVTPLSSLSDWIHCFSVRGSYEHYLFSTKKTSYGFIGKWYNYSKNSPMNYGSFWLKFQQQLSKHADVRLEYTFMDNVYLRNFTDRDTRKWQTAEYDYSEFRLKFPIRFVPEWTITPLYTIRTIYYNPYFTEFDSKGNSLGIEISYQPIRKLQFQLEYKFVTMDNVGHSQATGSIVLNPVSAESEYGDSSYDEDDATVSGSYAIELENIGKLEIAADYRIRNRVYTTNLSLQDAPFHRGRKHILQTVGIEVRKELMRYITVTPRVEFEKRLTTSPNPTVPKYKNYNASRFFIEMSYRVF
ncbi:MAG: hypothetical protein N2450_08720 [bacterium]|nr:hypothetical protein [bacterium]